MNGSDVSETSIGLCGMFLKIMAEVAYYNFTILIEGDLELGVIMSNKTVTGLLKRLHTHEIDGAAAGMVLNWNRLQKFDFTAPDHESKARYRLRITRTIFATQASNFTTTRSWTPDNGRGIALVYAEFSRGEKEKPRETAALIRRLVK
ncbi:hypothetical protein EVAR_79876_1 [Eumeta japonica]|uniref:Uncharacterized protein n=1 Tax=Eumeta variegata TaxID=151549 RepID=A0A4C1U098_EUMVA|nr:hypothetical protein EVAR_79876_1 [Eumeta japonica]